MRSVPKDAHIIARWASASASVMGCSSIGILGGLGGGLVGLVVVKVRCVDWETGEWGVEVESGRGDVATYRGALLDG
jgi:hypothetical protein